MANERGFTTPLDSPNGLAMIFTIFRRRKKVIKNAAAGVPVVIHGGDLPIQSMESEGACCQTRKLIHALRLKISVPMAIRVTPRSKINPAHTAKMTSAAVPRLSDGMESGDTCLDQCLRDELDIRAGEARHEINKCRWSESGQVARRLPAGHRQWRPRGFRCGCPPFEGLGRIPWWRHKRLKKPWQIGQARRR